MKLHSTHPIPRLLGGAGVYPDFLGIGAQKAGTSWLHSVLSAQPGVWLPPLKEIHYFDRKFPNPNVVQYGRGGLSKLGFDRRGLRKRFHRLSARKVLTYLRSLSGSRLLWEWRYYRGERDDRWYASLFKPGAGRLTGDITPAYSRLDSEAVRYVHQLMPNAKIIFLLRDPIDRAWSHALMDLSKHAGRPAHNISDEEFIAHFHSDASRLRGSYSDVISRWQGVFSEQQLFVGYFEDIVARPEGLIRDVLAFLGLDSVASIPIELLSRKINAGSKIPMPSHLQAHLSRIYLPELQKLESLIGGYARQWRNTAESKLVS